MEKLCELKALEARKERANRVAKLSPVLDGAVLYAHDQKLANEVLRITIECSDALLTGAYVETAKIDTAVDALECELGILDAMIDRGLETLETALQMDRRIEGAVD